MKLGKPRSEKSLLRQTLGELHTFRLNDAMISHLTGYSKSYVRDVLNDMGRTERWSDVSTVRAALPASLLESCAVLLTKVNIESSN